MTPPDPWEEAGRRRGRSGDAVRALVEAARVAVLATVTGGDGGPVPHVVPCCFALDGNHVVTAVDDVKAKSTSALRRLENVARHRDAALLVDHYDDADWSRLWWVRLDGTASVLEDTGAARRRAAALLTARYPQYADHPPPGPFLSIAVTRVVFWTAGAS